MKGRGSGNGRPSCLGHSVYMVDAVEIKHGI